MFKKHFVYAILLVILTAGSALPGKIVYGDEIPVTTENAIPTVTTLEATDIAIDSARLNMAYDFRDYVSGNLSFEYRRPIDTDWTVTGGELRSGSGSYALTISGLSSNTTYYYRAVLGYESKEIYGLVKQFISDIIIVFPDVNLEAQIREDLNKPTGDIYKSELESMTALYAYSANISDLTGLEYCINLQTLLLWNNRIADVTKLANLPNLKELDLNENLLSDLSPLQYLTSLTKLQLSHNEISDVSPLANLTNVTYLGLMYNRITDISPLASVIKLQTMGLGHNQIADITPLTNLINLSSLGLEYNQISDISPLAGLTNLFICELEVNQINDISPLVANAGLVTGDTVVVSNNPLTPLSLHIYILELKNRGVNVIYNQQPLSVSIKDVTDITTTSATLNGSLDSLGAHSSVDVCFEWGLVPGGPYPYATDIETLTTTDNFSASLAGLNSYSTYFYRAKAAGIVTVYSDYGLFTTARLTPTVSTFEATSITTDSAQLNMSYNLKEYVSGDVSFAYKQASEVTWIYTDWVSVSYNGTYARIIDSLTNNTSYDFKAMLRYYGLETQGAIEHFTTPEFIVTFPDINLETTIRNAISKPSGDIYNTDVESLTVFDAHNSNISVLTGLEYCINLTNIDLSDNQIVDISPLVQNTGLGTGDTLNLQTNLLSPESLYIHIPALENRGVDVAFDDQPISVITKAATGITTSTAMLNGNLSSLGALSSMEVSFEWGQTQGGPYNHETVNATLTVTDNFSASLTGLSPSTTYYFRAKAADIVVKYGDVLSFITNNIPPSGGGGGGGGGSESSGGGGGGGGADGKTVTSLRGSSSSTGVVWANIQAVSLDSKCTVDIPYGTKCTNANGYALSSMTIAELRNPDAAQTGVTIVGTVYELGPKGASFDPSITLRIKYNETGLPAGKMESSLKIALWDAESGTYKAIDCLVDTETNQITASVSHFSRYTIIAVPVVTTTPKPTPAPTPTPKPTPTPTALPAPAPSITPSPAPTAVPSTTSTEVSTPATTPATTNPVAALPTKTPTTNRGVIIGILAAGVIVIGLLVFIFVLQKRRTFNITTNSLPDGEIGTAYSQTLGAAGGTAPYTWSIKTGTLPRWAKLDPLTGVISGTPSSGGIHKFTVIVTDSLKVTDTQSLSIKVDTVLPVGHVGTAYSKTLAGSGGVPPYTWTITRGNLPAGLSLDTATGAITGKPTTAGTTAFTVRLRDSSKTRSLIQNFTITIKNSPASPDGRRGKA